MIRSALNIIEPADPRRARRIERTLNGKTATDPRKWKPVSRQQRERTLAIANGLWNESGFGREG